MASATAYSQRPKFVSAEHLATAESENCAYGSTLLIRYRQMWLDLPTLESGIDVGQGINVGPGKLGKKNKRRALNTHVLCSE